MDTGRWAETVLTDVDLSIAAGRITVLLGGPGAGKTMIAYALTGRLPAAARATGEVLIDGTVGYIPQDGIDAFSPERTVGSQLQALERQHGTTGVLQACTAAHYPLDALDLLPRQHSAGQIQRAAVAAALLTTSETLIADSPTSSLDQDTAYGVWQSLRERADAGTALLVVTGDLSMLTATGYADRLVIIDEGRVIAEGTMTELGETTDPRVRIYFQQQ